MAAAWCQPHPGGHPRRQQDGFFDVCSAMQTHGEAADCFAGRRIKPDITQPALAPEQTQVAPGQQQVEGFIRRQHARAGRDEASVGRQQGHVEGHQVCAGSTGVAVVQHHPVVADARRRRRHLRVAARAGRLRVDAAHFVGLWQAVAVEVQAQVEVKLFAAARLQRVHVHDVRHVPGAIGDIEGKHLVGPAGGGIPGTGRRVIDARRQRERQGRRQRRGPEHGGRHHRQVLQGLRETARARKDLEIAPRERPQHDRHRGFAAARLGIAEAIAESRLAGESSLRGEPHGVADDRGLPALGASHQRHRRSTQVGRIEVVVVQHVDQERRRIDCYDAAIGPCKRCTRAPGRATRGVVVDDRSRGHGPTGLRAGDGLKHQLERLVRFVNRVANHLDLDVGRKLPGGDHAIAAIRRDQVGAHEGGARLRTHTEADGIRRHPVEADSKAGDRGAGIPLKHGSVRDGNHRRRRLLGESAYLAQQVDALVTDEERARRIHGQWTDEVEAGLVRGAAVAAVTRLAGARGEAHHAIGADSVDATVDRLGNKQAAVAGGRHGSRQGEGTLQGRLAFNGPGIAAVAGDGRHDAGRIDAADAVVAPVGKEQRAAHEGQVDGRAEQGLRGRPAVAAVAAL